MPPKKANNAKPSSSSVATATSSGSAGGTGSGGGTAVGVTIKPADGLWLFTALQHTSNPAFVSLPSLPLSFSSNRLTDQSLVDKHPHRLPRPQNKTAQHNLQALRPAQALRSQHRRHLLQRPWPFLILLILHIHCRENQDFRSPPRRSRLVCQSDRPLHGLGGADSRAECGGGVGDQTA